MLYKNGKSMFVGWLKYLFMKFTDEVIEYS